jgi:ligand-binding sensor domain-containing protein/serine phosphatase RsbU (regulator of sigma subunit)
MQRIFLFILLSCCLSYNYSIALLSCCLSYNYSIAQTYNFINYNVGEGLEQSDILCVSQSSNGFLLYGSNGGGLGYYDGYRFNAVKEKNGLANNVVFSISTDANNNIWVATNGGVSELTPNLKKVLRSLNPGTPFYCSFYSNEQDRLYFGSGKGLFYLDNSSDSLVKLVTGNEQLNGAFINTVYTDADANLWIGTRQKGVFRVKGNEVISFTEKEGLPSNYVKTVIGSEGKIWVGTLMGLSLIENNEIKEFSLPNRADGHLTITSATKYRDELVFGALNNHLYFVNPKDNSFRLINKLNGFDFQKVWSVFTDNESNLWFGTVGQGLSKFNSTFTYYNQANGLQGSYINTVYCNDEEVWLGYKGAGIDIIKNNEIVKTLSTKEIGSSIMNRIINIDGKMFIGRNGGLSVYDQGKIAVIPFSKGEKTDVYSIYSNEKTVFVGTKLGLYELKGDSLVRVLDSPSDFIFDIIAKDETLYLASNNGYYTFKNNKFEFVSEQENFSAGRVRSFVLDEKGGLWIATNEGIYVKTKNDYSKIDEQKGMSSDNVYFLQKDADGYIWAGTNKGVDRIQIASFYKNKERLNVRGYSKAEGLIGVESNLNSVSLSSKNQLWLGTINGVYLYNKIGDEINKIPPQITLNNIKLNFNDVNWSKYTKDVHAVSGLPTSLELNHTNNNFIFEYVGISLKNPDKVFYQYKLEGLDQDWLPITKDRKAVYTALTPGDYTFMLKAKNNDDVWQETPVEFSFTIFPPWYQTRIFYISVVLLIIIAIYLIMYFRTRNLKKTQQKLTQQVDERTKELREEKEKVELINIEIEEQKTVIEVANKNITDSINYAKKIQEAILPKSDKLEKYVSNISVLYLPKDVVSGDFYWFDKLDSKLILAAADCTGHGVPGAFMSMIGVNNLNQIILENNITNPSNILSELNVAIKKVLRQEDKGSESRDGMDISICTIDVANNKLQYAGAFRPLLYIRDNELMEIKGSRNPIGGNAPIDFEYSLNEMEFKEGDVFYMFSDGYPDQFGGAKGKKFMNKRLKQLFMDNHKKSPEEQKEILKKEFYAWMRDEEQVDDILVMIIQF